MKRDMIIYRKPILIGSAAILALLLLSVGNYAFRVGHNPLIFLIERFRTLLIFGGLIFTSIIFWEFKSSASRVHFLSIPASNLEKLISRWTYTALIFPIFCCLVCLIVYLVYSPIIDFNMSSFHSRMISQSFISYWILHPIVFMFSIWYNRYNAPLTLGSGLVFLLGTALVSYIAHRFVFHEAYNGFKIIEDIKIDVNPKFQDFTEQKIASVAKIFGFVVIPLFFSTVSYFKLKEKEA